MRYTSTAEKRRSALATAADFKHIENYGVYQERKEEMMIKEKNKNKKLELEVWLTKNFGLSMEKLVEVLHILGSENYLLSKWS